MEWQARRQPGYRQRHVRAPIAMQPRHHYHLAAQSLRQQITQPPPSARRTCNQHRHLLSRSAA
eukprot:5722028-Lingulodinium_polyedra.AAC.1